MILVTGSSGFLGERLMGVFGERAVGLQRSSRELGGGRRFFGDLTSSESVERVLRQLEVYEMTHIIHTAAITPWSKNPDFSLDLVMAESVARLCGYLKIPRLIFVSGWNVYDMSGRAPFSEQTLIRPVGEYGASKFAVEQFFAQRIVGVKVLNLRLASVYGVGQVSPGLIPNMVTSALNDRVLHLNAVQTKRDYLNNEDVAQAIARLVKIKDLPSALNIGSGGSISVLDVAKTIQRIFKQRHSMEISIEFAKSLYESVPIDNRLSIAEAEKRGLLREITPFDKGIADYIDWRKDENIL